MRATISKLHLWNLILIALLAIGLAGLGVGCPTDEPEGDDDTTDDGDDDTTDGDDDTTEDEEDPPECIEEGAPRTVDLTDDNVPELVEGINQLSMDLYHVNRPAEGNLFFSAFSMSSALSMLLGGAEGSTEAQMLDVLGVTIDENDWHDVMGLYSMDLDGDKDRCYTLYAANAAWGQDGLPFETDYTELLDIIYGAPMEMIDFEADPEAAREMINTWVEDNTEDRIQDLFAPGDITVLTKFVLANAIYFYSTWETEFDPDDTYDSAFWISDSEQPSVPIMSMHADLHGAYDWERGLSVVELMYTGGDVSMVLLVPDADDGIAELEDELTLELIDEMIDRVHEQPAVLRMPSFELQTEIPAGDNLMAMGMTDAFDEFAADLSGIVPPEHIDGNLHVHKVRHKGFIKVDEVGTEAAAATGVSGGDDDGGELYIDADHPFIYLIRDRVTGAILFMGRMSDPRG